MLKKFETTKIFQCLSIADKKKICSTTMLLCFTKILFFDKWPLIDSISKIWKSSDLVKIFFLQSQSDVRITWDSTWELHETQHGNTLRTPVLTPFPSRSHDEDLRTLWEPRENDFHVRTTREEPQNNSRYTCEQRTTTRRSRENKSDNIKRTTRELQENNVRTQRENSTRWLSNNMHLTLTYTIYFILVYIDKSKFYFYLFAPLQ
jgi:hypothetical protein